jgi:hypothetical protein
MASFTQGDTRAVLQQDEFARYQNNGSAVPDSRRTRPLWFDGRFLSARDLEHEQNYFLQRQADLVRSPGFGIVDGLMVSIVSSNGQSQDIVTITAGHGITPAGEQVMVPANLTIHLSSLRLQPNLDVKFGVALEAAIAPTNRTGLFAIALQPVQFTANPITAFPTTIQGTRTSHDGDIVEATSIALVPYPDPINTNDPTTKQAAVSRQIFLSGNASKLPDSLLPLALVSLQNGVIQWLDTYMLRRESGAEFTGVRFGLTDPALQQAYLQQYDSQLQQVVNSLLRQNLPSKFAATDHFQALPPAGRFPLASLNTDGFTQAFFPPQMDVRLSIVPDDEIAGLFEASLALPPIDLTLDPNEYTNFTVFAMIPVPRSGFAKLSSSLPEVPLTSTLPQVLGSRQPIDLLRFFQGATGFVLVPPAVNNSWQSAIGAQTYGFYVRRRNSPTAIPFATVPATATTTTTPAPQTTATPTTSTTGAPRTTTTSAAPTTTTTAPPTTTAAPTTTTAAPTTTTVPPPPTTTTPRPTTTIRTTFTIIPTTPPFTIVPTTRPFTLPPTTIPLTIRPPTTIPLTIRPQLTLAPLIAPTTTAAPLESPRIRKAAKSTKKKTAKKTTKKKKK